MNLKFGSGAGVRRVSNGEFDEGSMFLLRLQGWTKPSTNTNILLFFFPIDSSWDFDLVHGIVMLVRRRYSNVTGKLNWLNRTEIAKSNIWRESELHKNPFKLRITSNLKTKIPLYLLQQHIQGKTKQKKIKQSTD